MTWKTKKVLVTVKAYPEKSKKHGSSVCTAGVTDEGEWIRLYPMPISLFTGSQKISRYDWIEVECQKATDEKLGRKESYRVRPDSIRVLDQSLSSGKRAGHAPWDERNRILLPKVASSLEVLMEQYKTDKTSLGLIKPTEILRFYTREPLQEPPLSTEYQQSLTSERIPIIADLPHPFAYEFRCDGCADGKTHDIKCLDWELFESYRSWWRKYQDLQLLWEKLHLKFFSEMREKNLYFFVGMHSLQPTWLIIGLYYPKNDKISPITRVKSLSDFS